MSVASEIQIGLATSVNRTGALGGTASGSSVAQNRSVDVAQDGSSVDLAAAVADQSACSSETSKWKEILASNGILTDQHHELAQTGTVAEPDDQAHTTTFGAKIGRSSTQITLDVNGAGLEHSSAKMLSNFSARTATASNSSRSGTAKWRRNVDVDSTASGSAISGQTSPELSVAGALQASAPTPLGVTRLEAADREGAASQKCEGMAGTNVAVIALAQQRLGPQSAMTALTASNPEGKWGNAHAVSEDHTAAQSQSTVTTNTLDSGVRQVTSSAIALGESYEVTSPYADRTLSVDGAVSFENAHARQIRTDDTKSTSPASTSRIALNTAQNQRQDISDDSSAFPSDLAGSGVALSQPEPAQSGPANGEKIQAVVTKTDKSATAQQAPMVQEAVGPPVAHSAYQADSAATSSEEAHGTSPNRSEAAVNVNSAFTALDSSHGAPATTWTATNPRTVEAGYHDSSLGWVSVRAQSDAAGVHAAVIPASQDAAHSLTAQLSGLSTYLSEHRSPIGSVTIDTSGMNMSDQPAGSGAQSHDRQDTNRAGPERSTLPNSIAPRLSEGSELNNDPTLLGSAGGTYISVLA